MHEDIEFQYCPVCCGTLHSKTLKPAEPDRLVCSKCDFVFYLDPKVVACSIVEMEGRIVLLKRAIDPQKGKWVLPGGYVDRGEEVKAAALREMEEECGLKIRTKELLGLYSYPGKLSVVVVYVAEPLGGNLIVGDETAEVGLYSPESIPWGELAFQSTIDALKDYLKKREHSR
jgi:ADP-ribose pyrophosphatase YjhB (NUDIX family)